MENNKANILIVDDTRANLRLLASILNNKEYTVRPVPSGSMALSAAQVEPPDLILLDIMMPQMSGYEVCEKLKTMSHTQDIPVIFISAKNEVLDKVKAFSLGGVDYITKPFQAEEVLARVKTHLSLRNLQKHLEIKNQVLTNTLQKLKDTQNQMILREKMAALGQIIAGIAHEINTPLGAIRASISNISNALDTSIHHLPRIFQELSLERQADFFKLLEMAFEDKKTVSSREARKFRRDLTHRLESYQIDEPESIANILVNMGIFNHISVLMPLFQEKNNIFILETAYNLFVQKNNSSNIVMAVERASKMVFALKSYTRHDDSGEKMKTAVSDGIDVVLTLYHNQLKHGITVIRDYAEVTPILCYPDELNQVWTNLIHNAIFAMNGKGKLKIKVFQKDDDVGVQITDCGCGIPDTIKSRIFEPFFTTKSSGEGSGLGLDIVSKIIERHEGKIEFESQPGKTSFTVFLPIADERGLG